MDLVLAELVQVREKHDEELGLQRKETAESQERLVAQLLQKQQDTINVLLANQQEERDEVIALLKVELQDARDEFR